MKHSIITVLGCLFVTMAATGYAASATADATSDCRQEALDYGLSTEELNDYIDGCLASRGEYIDDSTADMDYAPSVETDDLPDLQTDDTDVAQ